MDPVIRTFARDGARLTLRRESTGDGLVLVAVESGRPRTFPFTDGNRLLQFQNDMEDFLQRTGWSLLDTAVPEVEAEPQPAPAPVALARRQPTALRLSLAEEIVSRR